MDQNNSSQQSENYYDILQINKQATPEQIQKAYKKLALKWHPDQNLDNQEQATKRFKQISQAYTTLSNKDDREFYDSYGHAQKSSGGDGNDVFRSFFQMFFRNRRAGGGFGAGGRGTGGFSRGNIFFGMGDDDDDDQDGYFQNQEDEDFVYSFLGQESEPQNPFGRQKKQPINQTTITKTTQMIGSQLVIITRKSQQKDDGTTHVEEILEYDDDKVEIQTKNEANEQENQEQKRDPFFFLLRNRFPQNSNNELQIFENTFVPITPIF